MRGRIYWACLALGGLLVGLLGPLVYVQAQTAAPVTALTINATLQTDGSIAVTDQLSYLTPAPLSWTIFGSARSITVQANGIATNRWHTESQTGGKKVVVANSASNWTITYLLTSALIRHNDRDQVYIKILDAPGFNVENVHINLTLPNDVPGNQLTGNAYAINGAENPESNVTSARQITYSTEFASSSALFTVSANWPKSVLSLTHFQEWRLSLLNLATIPWIVVGLLLPFAAFVILLSVLWTIKRTEQKVVWSRSQPPSALAPILVGVLVNKKIYPEEIVAELVDLCQRGYLVIVKKSEQYYLTQRALPDEHLQAWERDIIEQLFPVYGMKFSEQNAKSMADGSFFSPKVRDAFNRIYEVVTAIGAFKENPHVTRVRYKIVALAIYFTALGGCLWVAISGSSSLLFWPLFGSLALSSVIIRLSARLTRYTPTGEQERERWQGFGNFLAAEAPLGLSEAQNHLYEKYLAYAIALHRSEAWAARFENADTVIIRPDWFVSYEDLGPLQLAAELTKFTRIVGAELTKLHGPSVG